jgi:periplasmic copper chaperone A
MSRLLLALIFFLGLAQAGAAQTGANPSIDVSHPWARATATKTGAAYFTVLNKGASDDRLIAAAAPAVADKAQLHVTIEDNGVTKMRPLPALEVKAGSEAVLKPGTIHLMLIGLKAPLKIGQSFPVTLTFEKAGNVEVMVSVEKAGATNMPGMDHSMPGMKM